MDTDNADKDYKNLTTENAENTELRIATKRHKNAQRGFSFCVFS